MRRPAATVVGLAFSLLAAPLTAQDSAQVIVTDTVQMIVQGPAAAAASHPTPPTFRPGQWGARFSLSGGWYGIGALRFTSEKAAWTLNANVIANGSDWSGTEELSLGIDLGVGRRWFGEGHGRVRPFSGLGISGGFDTRKAESGPNEQRTDRYRAAFRGELGATIFVAPELSIGAIWGANLSYLRSTQYLNDADMGSYGSLALSAGYLSIEGTFYF